MTGRIDTSAFLEALDTKYLGRDPYFLDETGSTNDWMSFRLTQPKVERLLVMAENQTMGRGRMGRSWLSRPGENLTFSLAWAMPEGLANPAVVTLAVAVALAEALEAGYAVAPVIKYPNDLLLNEKKVAGILTELKSAGEEKFAVIGVGLNVNCAQEAFAGDLGSVATSLRIETGKRAAREYVLAFFLNRLEPALELLASDGLKDIMVRYRRLALPLMGREVTIQGAGDVIKGKAEGVDGHGALLVRIDDGSIISVSSGEATFHRP